jgi:NMD protein affecting ribosome stability and mRNA decay
MNAQYDFSALTENQKALLTFQGWSVGSVFPQPSPSTVKKLIARGLVIAHELVRGHIKITEYEVPISVYAAWCEHCARYYRDPA